MQKAVRAACCSHVEGMNEHSLLTEDEAAFEGYLDTLAAALQHRSRKQPLRDYCTGLLLPEGRKSMEPMAARLAPARTRTMHKTLLNFVSEGAWSDEAVLAAMRSQVLPAMQAHGPLRFWIVDESGMPKKGKHSVGVARQYCGEVGKVDNCQVMVSLSVATEAACLPLAARLYRPEAWAVDEERRSKAPRRRLPEQTSPRPGADPRRARRGGAARRRPGR